MVPSAFCQYYNVLTLLVIRAYIRKTEGLRLNKGDLTSASPDSVIQ